jgi:tetratricopeptide (TPR) repeat protein
VINALFFSIRDHARALMCAALVLLAPIPRLGGQGDDTWKDLVADAQHAAGDHDYSKAEQLFLKALHEAERFAADDWRVGVTLQGLGPVYGAEKRFNDGEKALQRSREIVAETKGDDSLELASVDFDTATLLLSAGRPVDAVASARKTVSTYERLLGGVDTQTADALCLLGNSLRAAKTLPEAETALRRCLDIRQNDGGIDTPEFADALYGLAMTYSSAAKYALAEPRFTLAEKIREKTLGLTSPVLAQTFEDHATVLKSMGRDKEAARLLVLAGAIRRSEKKGKN